jgi:hypothetical protein
MFDPPIVRALAPLEILRGRLEAHARAYDGAGCGELFEAKVFRLTLLLLDEHEALAQFGPGGDVLPALRAAAAAIEALAVAH